ncbi:hypothetical protein [Gordonia sp. (in: high G+C Gram-positive bacteria)]|uniref:hypothetical protein n=1 Tax=Gordonia sp. (in: high G+C Gram-positive bacteria) TaxID=84139 RepID=UPI0016A95A12|nr:hypothetical protein [Gordonia sp. (in: high G+C Gram-positive bacteria)]NLG48119.1 hypothetical protein [Gordonia sp. (in: high G+C Gram-positive bacteria)]
MDQKSNLRLKQAHERYAVAVERQARTRAAAAPAIERRSHRRAAMVRLAVVAAVVVAAVLLGIGWWAHSAADSLSGDLADQRAAQSAAEKAIVTMLTADPADASSYVRNVLTVTTGDQQIRIKGASGELEALIAAQSAPATGQVLSSGVAASDGAGTTVLVIAQTTTPELVGGAAGQNRVGVAMTMERVGDQWLVAQTKAVS